jgi:hypothetical protein
MLDAAHTWRAQNLTIVGDPFARPLLFELDANAAAGTSPASSGSAPQA